MKELVRCAMENDFGFKLPLKTSIEVGDTWGEMHQKTKKTDGYDYCFRQFFCFKPN